ncbi:MAG: hypothetical protein HND51_17525 [Chloroflexi bacterium]|nr:hypothetical protein [Chloroflexota bacterium]
MARTGLALITASLQEKLVYRFDLIMGLLRALIQIFVFHQLWAVLFTGVDDYAGFTLEQTQTYVVISMSIMPLLDRSFLPQVNERIRSGNIVFDLARPVYYGNLLLYQGLGQFAATLLTTSLPLLVFSFVFFSIAMPDSVFTWITFLASFCMAYYTAFLMDLIASLWGFWIASVWGLFYAKWNLLQILGGMYIPLWFFPSPFKEIVLLLPFRGVAFTPLSILVGGVAPEELPMALGLQIFWIIMLLWFSKFMYARVVKKLAVQGG